VLALYFAFTGNLSTACPDHATSCIKIDDWSMSGGHYYRRFPYDSQGNDDPGAPWVEISRQVYVAELGTRLREAAAGRPFCPGRHKHGMSLQVVASPGGGLPWGSGALRGPVHDNGAEWVW